VRCAFLTMADEGDFVTDYALAIPHLEALGWTVELVPWRNDSTRWDDYDAVYIAAPWDYPEDPGAFSRTLAQIEASPARLVNALSIVTWNLDKAYLRDLELSGVAIVPTIFREGFDAAALDEACDRFSTDRIIIKPRVGANAADTFVLPAGGLAPARQRALARLYRERPHMLQPYVRSIETVGEYSLFYLNGAYSHAIQKVPAAGDFRVQEEHGAAILPASPEPSLAAAGAVAVAAIPGRTCYARADFVANDGAWQLMELELVEPSLYLRMEPGAPARFAAALDAHVRAPA